MTETAEASSERAYLKVSEVAHRLNVSVRHVYDLVADGELESARFGRGRLGLRVTAGSLAAFEARRLEQAS